MITLVPTLNVICVQELTPNRRLNGDNQVYLINHLACGMAEY